MTKCPRTEHGFIISPKNAKLGTIPSLSVPRGLTCPRDVPCLKKCYVAGMSRYTNGSTDKTYAVNYDKMVAVGGWKLLVDDIVQYINEEEPRYFRWNVSGDAFSYWYVWAMCQIAVKCPETHFLVYTKQYVQIDKYLSINNHSIPDNLIVYLSEWGDYKPSQRLKNMFNVAYFEDKEGAIKVSDATATVCPGCCSKCDKRCFYGRGNVIFKEH